jgi:rhodanese-related sulfurtransferase
MASHPEWIITADELAPVLAQVTLIDVREPEEFADSRIELPEGSEAARRFRLIPMAELMARVETEVPDKDDDIVIYCAHGVRSMHALMAMARMGYRRLRSLDGGICAWEERGHAARA